MTTITEAQLISEVDTLRGFVVHRMPGYRSSTDDVLQRVRETVWKSAWKYDPERGTPTEFVFGITRNVVRAEVRRLGNAKAEVPLADEAYHLQTSGPGPHETVWAASDTDRLLRVIADECSECEWLVVTESALSEKSCEEIGRRLRLCARTVRRIRHRVSEIAGVARRALVIADEQPDLGFEQSIAWCLPDDRLTQQIAELLEKRPVEAAAQVGISVGEFRRLRGQVRRLVDLASSIVRGGAA